MFKKSVISFFPSLAAVILAAVFLTAARTSYAQQAGGNEAQRAQWVLTLSDYVTWPQHEQIDTFLVGVYGYNVPELAELQRQKNIRTINKKPFKIVHFKKTKEITYTHILYVNPNYSNDLPQICTKLDNQSTLIITSSLAQNSNLRNFCMINLLLRGRGEQFEVNSQRAEDAKISISEKVLAQGGSNIDLKKLNYGKDKELQQKENMLKIQEQQLEQKNNELTVQTLDNDIKREQILFTKFELENKEKEIESQKMLADKLLNDAEKLKAVLLENNVALKKQEQEIKEKQQQLDVSGDILSRQQERIREREKQIGEHEKMLNQQSGQINAQKRVIFVALIFSGIILVLVVITTISSISRKRKNRELARLNDEVDRQKDHIQAQSQQLLQINKELEKLSIVASQTDNAVVIMDNQGNVEWINRGFTNMSGFTFEDLHTHKKDNLTSLYASNNEIQAIKDECLSSCQSKIFESEIKTKDGKYLWIQSTLTPILNENNEITRLVTIDTDITQIKEQENAILAQGMTLAAQRDELAQQKELIEEQNAHINTSLTYAKTIQETVMPLEVNITKCYKYFGLFIPLQIVSGDFYWFTRVPDNPDMTFTAAVDCTGHGVAGAFMCMISTRLLNEIIVEHKIYDTEKILTSLDAGLKTALKQDTTDNNDSLEICICKVLRNENEKYTITYSGAKRPLYIYHEESGDFETLKADSKTIGGIMSRRNTTEFTSTERNLVSGDKIYMTTDGFINQFDPNNKKFGSDRFVNLLKSICTKELSEQKTILEQEYYNYKGDAEQNDDITIFAIQLL